MSFSSVSRLACAGRLRRTSTVVVVVVVAGVVLVVVVVVMDLLSFFKYLYDKDGHLHDNHDVLLPDPKLFEGSSSEVL